MQKNNMGNERYKGPATVKQMYRRSILVVCPVCSSIGIVEVDNPWFPEKGLFKCTGCHHVENSNSLIRYKVVLQRNCDTCGQNIQVHIPNKKKKQLAIKVECPKCGTSRTYKPRNEIISTQEHTNKEIADPIFGYSLWLQTEVKGHIFWAYNQEHLAEIRNYVGSKLRERQTLEYTTMVEKLPQFIRDAKNRSLVIKVISKLELTI